jgi:hypothetical protein
MAERPYELAWTADGLLPGHLNDREAAARVYGQHLRESGDLA